MMLVCEVCDIDFEWVQRHNKKRQPRMTCSRSCANALRSKHRQCELSDEEKDAQIRQANIKSCNDLLAALLEHHPELAPASLTTQTTERKPPVWEVQGGDAGAGVTA